MTESKTHNVYTRACLPLKWFSCVALMCLLIPLGGCSGLDFLAHKDEKTQLEKKREQMREEISYLDEKTSKRGNNPKNLFGGSIRSDSERMDRLERAVQDMRNEFDRAQPSIKRLTDLEGEIQKLVHELKVINNEEMPSTQVIKKPYKPKKTTISKYKAPAKTGYQKKAIPPVQNGKASVYDVRIGEHPGKTRIVIDVNGKTGFSVDIDNDENIMIIELPKAGWTTAKSKSFARSHFISSYKVESSDNGHILILQLKRNAKVTYKDDLAGKGTSRRLVIDLQN